MPHNAHYCMTLEKNEREKTRLHKVLDGWRPQKLHSKSKELYAQFEVRAILRLNAISLYLYNFPEFRLKRELHSKGISAVNR